MLAFLLVRQAERWHLRPERRKIQRRHQQRQRGQDGRHQQKPVFWQEETRAADGRRRGGGEEEEGTAQERQDGRSHRPTLHSGREMEGKDEQTDGGLSDLVYH